MTGREERLLDAAIDVLGAGGPRALTHRAVDAAAGLPAGSTSNRFRTREALLVGVLGRILQRETALWIGFGTDIDGGGTEAFAAELGQLIQQLTDGARMLTQARRAVFVEANGRPALREEIARARQELVSSLVPMLAALGSSDPARDSRHLLALVDGLLAGQLADPVSDFEPATALAALLRGLCTPSRR